MPPAPTTIDRRSLLGALLGAAAAAACSSSGDAPSSSRTSSRSGEEAPQKDGPGTGDKRDPAPPSATTTAPPPKFKQELPEDVRAMFDAPGKLTIRTVEPLAVRFQHDAGAGPTLHDFRVIGEAVIESADEKKKVVELFYKGVADSDGLVAACFNPRLAISAERDGKTIDAIICFECLTIRIYRSATDAGAVVLTAKSVEAAMNAFFTSKGLRLAP